MAKISPPFENWEATGACPEGQCTTEEIVALHPHIRSQLFVSAPLFLSFQVTTFPSPPTFFQLFPGHLRGKSMSKLGRTLHGCCWNAPLGARGRTHWLLELLLREARISHCMRVCFPPKSHFISVEFDFHFNFTFCLVFVSWKKSDY